MKGHTPIKDETYETIHRLMPIVCVDVVIMVEDKVLLIKRDKEPAKDQYWFPGGRLLKNESIKDAASRIVKSETNLNIFNILHLGFDETVFAEDPFGHGEGTHTVNHVYGARIKSMDLIALALDEHHTEYLLHELNDVFYNDKMDSYVKKFTILAEAAYRRR